MELRMLHLTRPGWGENKGQLQGTLEVTTKSGEIKLVLDEDKAEKMLALVAEQLVESAQEVANSLTCEIIEHKPALEDMSDA